MSVCSVECAGIRLSAEMLMNKGTTVFPSEGILILSYQYTLTLTHTKHVNNPGCSGGD